MHGVRDRECPHCSTRFETRSDLAHCVSCGCPTWPHHTPKSKRATYAAVRVFFAGIEMQEET